MKGIQDHSFHDGKILSISIFDNYYAIKDFHSICQDTSELSVNTSNEILDEAKQNILDNGGSEDDVIGLNSYSFIGSWQEKRIFEIAAKNIRFEDFKS